MKLSSLGGDQYHHINIGGSLIGRLMEGGGGDVITGGFCMGLSIGSEQSESPPIQLDLLPNTPVLHNNDIHRRGGGIEKMSNNRGRPSFELSSPNCSTDTSSFPMYMTSSSGRGGGKKRDHNNNNNEEEEAEAEADQAERTSSRACSDEENGSGSSRKKLRLTKQQSAFLEETFKEHNTLNPKQKVALANQLNLRPRQVEVWFQNRRARTKLKQTEVDCEYLKRCCETLKEENRRLQKELQDLRALKTINSTTASNPFYTLTMCPSCERVVPTTTSSSPKPFSPILYPFPPHNINNPNPITSTSITSSPSNKNTHQKS
jgi:homeobox-leucine zipper protein